MSTAKEKREAGLKIFRILTVLICIGGFLYHSLEFMQLYWTYPTVVDIQQSEPSEFDVPAFTICNTIGYNYTEICEGFDISPCLPSSLNKDLSKELCDTQDIRFSVCCYDDEMPEDFQAIFYNIFSEDVTLQPSDNKRLRIPLEDYFQCEILYSGKSEKCNLEHVIGPYYSEQEFPQYCYSIYSKWGQPNNKTRERIQKGAIMKFRFFLNASLSDKREDIRPRHNMPSTPSVQMAVHSPFFLPSPFLEGEQFLGGRTYDLRVKMMENNLLPPPYETNCTDYFKLWEQRGGKAPLNQMNVINECQLRNYLDVLGCVPLSIYYPHDYPICKSCPGGCNYTVKEKECVTLVDSYNQPCYSLFYEVSKTERVISIPYKMDLEEAKGATYKIPYYDCSGTNFWSIECSTVEINVLFDRFEVTVLSYNPKFEELEIFSVIGGYLGMWLGVSLVTVYDFVGSAIGLLIPYIKKWNKSRNKEIRKKLRKPY